MGKTPKIRLQPTGSSSDNLFKLTMSYDGSGRRISKTRWVKKVGLQDWEKELVTHYTGIGTEVREEFHNGTREKVNIVVNMPQGLGRYGIEDAEKPDFDGRTGDQLAGYIPNAKFEWYLKNHLGSTMLVYGTQADANPAHSDIGTPLAAYDYRAFGEMVELLPPPTGKVTENFTGKELDDEIALNYFGARYLDPMLGMWVSMDPLREFYNSFAYGPANPINGYDYDGNIWKTVGEISYSNVFWNWLYNRLRGMGESSNKAGRKVYYSANSNPEDIRIRHITQQWVYDPNVSDEINGLHPFGTRRVIDQNKVDEASAKRQYQALYSDNSISGWTDNMNWIPQVFDNSYKEFPSIELDYSNVYEPDGKVDVEVICENCID